MTIHTKTLFPFILPVLLLLFHQNQAIDFDEGCLLEGGGGGNETLLQFVFVVDRTRSMEPFMKTVYLPVLVALIVAIESFYRNTEFAISSFADWPKSAEPDLGFLFTTEFNPHNVQGACYDHRLKFTKSSLEVLPIVASLPALGNGGRENSLAALAFTAADNKIGWNTQPGKDVRRVLMLFTDQDYSDTLKKPGKRTEFKGDGTDTCEKSKPPNVKKMGEVLLKYKMSVLALLPLSVTGQNLFQIYQEHFGRIPGLPFCGHGFDFVNISVDKIVNLLIGCLREIFEGGGGGGNDKKQCVFGDPPGFNTLGL